MFMEEHLGRRREDWFDLEDEINVRKITKLFKMRHACNLLGISHVASELGVSASKIATLYHSTIHGSKDLKPFLNCSNDTFLKMLMQYEKEELDRQDIMSKALLKNELLIQDLKDKREKFAGIGTNKVKRRLNKLAATCSIAQAIRLALEIEDSSISAKDSYGTHQDKIYKQKQKLIAQLCELFKEQSWNYGIRKSEIACPTHVIYFEIPTCEQVSWHFSPENSADFPFYDSVWDKKENSTLEKLEKVAARLLSTGEVSSLRTQLSDTLG